MRDILQFYRSFFGNLTAFMVFSFFVSGCHTGEEPVSVTQVTVKKEATNRNQAGEIQADSIVKTRKKKPELITVPLVFYCLKNRRTKT